MNFLNSLLLYTTSSTLLLGCRIAFVYFQYPGIESLIAFYILSVLSFITIGLTFYVFLKRYKDIFNPLFVIAISSLIRILLPGLLLLFQGAPEYLSWMQISTQEWLIGLDLSMLSINGLIFGWLVTPRSLINFFSASAKWLCNRFPSDNPRVFLSAVVTTSIGFLLFLTYYFLQAKSGGILAIFESGSLRGSAEKNGSFRFSYLGLGMIYTSGTFVCSYILSQKNKKTLTAFIEPFIATVMLLPTGGRIGSLNPLIFGLTSFWQTRVTNKNASLKRSMILLISFITFMVYSIFLVNYRGGTNSSFIDLFSLERLAEMFESLVWGDIAILPIYALSATHAPGIMEGKTYPLIPGTLVNSFIQASSGQTLNTEIPGVFLVQSFFTSDRQWGPHTGMFVDIYLNSGIIYAIVGCVILGCLLRGIYEGSLKYLNAPIVVTVYTMLFWAFYWIFFESIMSSTDILYRIVISLSLQRFIFLTIRRCD